MLMNPIHQGMIDVIRGLHASSLIKIAMALSSVTYALAKRAPGI